MTTHSSLRSRPLRYIAINPYEDLSTSYNHAFWGETKAYGWAVANAKPRGGKIVCEYVDGTTKVVRDFSWVE